MENSGQIRDNMIIYENRRVEFSLCRRKIQLNNYGSMVKRLRLSPLTAHNNRRMKISRNQAWCRWKCINAQFCGCAEGKPLHSQAGVVVFPLYVPAASGANERGEKTKAHIFTLSALRRAPRKAVAFLKVRSSKSAILDGGKYNWIIMAPWSSG